MKKMILCLLALVLSLTMLCAPVMATEADNAQSEAPACQVVLTHVSLRPGGDALGY